MKEQVTKFDINAAFKALDEIEIPVVKGINPNRENLKEAVKRVDRTSMLIEDYYDVNNPVELEEAKEDREAEVAQAKLARIEKIVDLDAESEEDILPSYVGKTIIQCPQCMTLFYKNEEDLVKDENDPETVNVNEPCQHCGNVSGYQLIGKVAGVGEDEMDQFDSSEVSDEGTGEEENELDLNFDEEQPVEEEPTEEVEESEVEESEVEEEPVEEEEEEVKEESFVKPTGSSLMEQVEDALNESADEDLSKKLKAHNEYIEYLQQEIDKATEELNNAKNDFIKSDIQRKIDALEDALNNAIPDEVKADVSGDDLPTPEEADVEEVEEEPVEESVNLSQFQKECGEKSELKSEESEYKSLYESAESELKAFAASLSEDLNEEKEIELPDEVSDADFDKLMDSEEMNTPISDEEVQSYFEEDFDISEVEDLDEASMNKHISDYLTEVYENVENFETTSCAIKESKLTVEGNIHFKSGKERTTCFEFVVKENNPAKLILEGYNTDFAKNGQFTLHCVAQDAHKFLMTRSIGYKYKINNTLVEGLK